MSGEELKMIYEISGFTGKEFAKRLDMSRATLYNLFNDSVISLDVEKMINEDEQLSKKRQLLNVPDKKINKVPINEIDHVNRTINKAKELLNPEELPEANDKETVLRGDAADAIIRSNRILAELVELGIKAGAIQWTGKIHIDNLD
jgi:transcriptional regulator with XRE-family HTH domain